MAQKIQIRLFNAPVATPETNTRSVGTPLSDPNEIRVIRISADGKRHTRIYTGSRPADLDERCQAHADATGCWVQWHNAVDYKVFHPTNPSPDSPPISDMMKHSLPQRPNHRDTETGNLQKYRQLLKVTRRAERRETWLTLTTITDEIISNPCEDYRW